MVLTVVLNPSKRKRKRKSATLNKLSALLFLFFSFASIHVFIVPWVAAEVVLFLSLSVGNFRMGFRQGKGDPCEIERPGGASTNVGRRIAPVSVVLGAASWIGGRRGDHGCGLGTSTRIKRRRVHPTPPCCWSWGTRYWHLSLYNTSEPSSNAVVYSFPL